MRVEVVTVVTPELVAAFNRLMPQHSRDARRLTEELLRSVVEAPGNTVLIARDDTGRIVGTTTLVVYPTASNTLARIEDVVVGGEARGQGIGAALVNEALRLARERGAIQAELNSGAHRAAANRLYARLGFTIFNSNIFRFTFPTEPSPP